RATDEGMRKAFLLAQKAADDIIAQAERQKADLMKTAEREARAKIDGLRQELENEQLRLSSAQAATAAYVASLQQLYEQQAQYLANLSAIHAAPPSAVATTAQEIETTMERIVAEETPEPDPEDEFDPDPEDGEMPAEDPSDGGLYAEIMELNIKPRTAASAEEIDDEPEEFSEDAAEDPDNTSPTRRIDFNNLKFGRDYEIK
ncbi:MAG: DivIVA domain-containing protein, partial [Pseudoflavonifractor sp.]